MKQLINIFTISLGLFAMKTQAQTVPLSQHLPGRFGFGVRNDINFFAFNHAFGLGQGGHIKLGFSKRVNTEWFGDHISSNIGTNGYRHDWHIGWAVQFAIPSAGFVEGKVTPFFAGGQCFDQSTVGMRAATIGENVQVLPKEITIGSLPRGNAATHIGIGAMYFATNDFELNTQLLYMVHLQKDLEVDLDGKTVIGIHESEGFNLEGHVLLTFSASYYFINLWHNKKKN